MTGPRPQHAEPGDNGAYVDYDIVRLRSSGSGPPSPDPTSPPRPIAARPWQSPGLESCATRHDRNAQSWARRGNLACRTRGHIIREFLVDIQRSHNPLTSNIAIRPAADDFRHALGRLGLRKVFGHDDREEGADLAQRIWDHRERPFQTELDVLSDGADSSSVWRTASGQMYRASPALQARNHVARAHRLAVVEFQSVTQRDFQVLPSSSMT